MAETDNGETVWESGVGPVITVAEKSRVKPLLSSVFWSLVGVGMIAGGLSMATFEAPDLWTPNVEPDWFILLLGVGFLLLGWMLATTFVRRLVAVRDERVYFRAGPGGVSVGVVGWPRLTRLMLSYGVKAYEFSWEQVKTWYPYLMRVNGIPTTSEIQFEGTEGWKIGVDTLYFAGSRESLAASIAEAMERTDLLPDDEGEVDEDDEDEIDEDETEEEEEDVEADDEEKDEDE